MRVLKRNGQTEYFDFKKVEKVIRFACPDDACVSKFIHELEVHIKDGITTKELQETLIQFASEQITSDQPHWDKVASKLFIYDMYKEAGINRGYKAFGYGSFYKLLVKLGTMGLYDETVLDGYTKSQIEELGEYIVPERDYDLSYAGAVTLLKRYCIRGHSKEVYELPQESFMGVAMKIALAEKPEDRVRYAKMFYDEMSLLNGTEATPTMSNARKPNGQLSSCFIGMADDSLESIMHANGAMFAEVSKWGGGMGMYIGKVRAMGSPIRGFKNMSGGTAPWIRIMNDTAIACNQLGVRAGAISITLDVWHKDIFEFLEIKKDTGDLRRKAHDIFPSISMPDLFYKQSFSRTERVRDGKFYLFCPHEVRMAKGWSIEDFWGEEFERRYWECVDDPNIDKVEVDPMEIWKKIAEVDSETGTPFLFNRDTVNRDNPNKHKGMIYSTNLCVEICQNMSVQGPVQRYTRVLESGAIAAVEERTMGDFVVCNLATLNVGRVHTKEKIFKSVRTFVRMLDNVITVNELPIDQAKVTNNLYRAIGLGIGGWHHALAINGIFWESEEHIKFADQITEWIAMAAIEASADLGAEKGSYPYFEGSEWNTGEFFVRRGYVDRDVNGNIIPKNTGRPEDLEWYNIALKAMKAKRNAYDLAVAPNGSSSHYGGYTQSIDPVFGWVFHDGKKGQVLPIVAPDLDKVNPLVHYKRANTINQIWSIKANAARQKHIDQSQSFNLYIRPETTGEELIKYYAMIWKAGIKTKYYTRNMSAELDDSLDCEACKS